jgi:hypothetical protein
MAVRDLRVYADALNGQVSHYLDRNGLECDAVVHLRNGTSGLVEIKLGGSALIEEGAATLNALSGLVDTSRQEPVAFKMVVTATGDCAYRRTDGNGLVGCVARSSPQTDQPASGVRFAGGEGIRVRPCSKAKH